MNNKLKKKKLNLNLSAQRKSLENNRETVSL